MTASYVDILLAKKKTKIISSAFYYETRNVLMSYPHTIKGGLPCLWLKQSAVVDRRSGQKVK